MLIMITTGSILSIIVVPRAVSSLSVLTVVPRPRTELSKGEVIYHQPDFLISKHGSVREPS